MFPRFFRCSLLLALFGAPIFGCAAQSAAPVAIAPPPAQISAPRVAWQVVQTFPHDANAFTQGLLWHNGALYEATGLEGRSEVRRVDLPTGKTEQKLKIAPKFFGEGLAVANGKLFQLTWQDKTGFVYDLETFQLERQFTYENEGWGLTFDGQNLIQSDGTSTLTFRDPATFAAKKQLPVTWNGAPLRDLNELEWIEGEIWANVWQTDAIVRIDPQSGKVKSYLNLSGLLKPEEKKGADVLNGIAYDQKTKRIFVTGKNWPKLFAIRVQ